MSSRRQRRWWQFSLRSLLLAVVVVGPILGFLGPPLVRSLREWSPSGDATKPPASLAPHADHHDSDGYFESAETPLY